jgi:class III poly(R)-hydroxyalkanoic acid synthase PhaE subunit
MEKTGNPFLNPEWTEFQRQYLDALSSLGKTQTSAGSEDNKSSLWSVAFDSWCNAVEHALPPDNKPVFDSILRQSRVFYSIADQFTLLIQELSAVPVESEDWREVLARHVASMKTRFDTLSGGTAGMDWSLPWQGWVQTLSTMAAYPDTPAGTFARAITGGTPDRLFSIPGLGPAREFQDKLRAAAKAWKDYQQMCAEYHAAFAKVGRSALDHMQEKIIEVADTGKKISSMRQIYDLWIDSNEEAFAEFAFDQGYSRLYGDLVNALMRFRSRTNAVLNEILSCLSLPSLQGMDTMHRRQHRMGGDLQLLQAELLKLQGQLSAAAPAAAGGKPKRSVKRRNMKDAG